MFRQAVQFLVVVAVVAVTPSVVAQTDGWQVNAEAVRNAKVVARYRILLLKNPEQPQIFRGLISRVGHGPGLDRLIEQVRVVANKNTGPKPLVLLGHLLRERGKDAESLVAYEHAVEAAPHSSVALAALAAALDRGGQAAAADALFERALAGSAGTPRRRLLRTLADHAMARSDHARAVQWMRALVAERTKDYALRIELGETELRAHRFDDALSTFETAAKLAGRNGKRRAQALLDVGNIHRRMHDGVAAERSYRQALGLVGRENWMRRDILTRLIDVSRDLRKVPAMYEELVREWSPPSYLETMVLVGLCEELGRGELAVKWLERAARLDRRAVEPRTRLIARLDHQADAKRVRELYDEIVRLRPKHLPQRLERLEWLFFRHGEPEEAVKQLRALEAGLASDVVALGEVAATWLRFGLPEEALRVHRQLETTHPDDIHHLEAYGELLARLGRRSAADVVWQRLFAADSDPVRARLRVAEIAARVRNFEHAIELLEWVISREPLLTDARHRLAGLYETAKMWPEALLHWETLFFEHGVNHAGRRVIAIAQRTVFLGSRAVSPDDELLQRWESRYAAAPSPRVGIVLAKLRDALLGRMANGRALAEAIASADPGTLPASEHAAWVEAAEMVVREYEDTDPNRAVAMLERIAAQFGDRRVAAWRRAVDLALVHDDPKIAQQIISRAVAAAPNDAYVHAQAGAFFGAQKDRSRAIEHLQRAIALGTQAFDVHFDLAFHLTQSGEPDMARKVFMAVMRLDWGGTWATSAAFSAIDLCATDAELLEFEGEVRKLRGRIPADAFRAIVVATYSEIFLYAEDRAAAFERLASDALPLIVDAMQSDADDDRARAGELLASYPEARVVDVALSVWPAPKLWSVDMVWAVARTQLVEAGPALLAALRSEDDEVRRLAVFGLGFVRFAKATKPLALLLRDGGAAEGERALAAAALGRIGTTRSTEALAWAVRAGESAELKLVATWALGQSDSSLAAQALSERLGEGGSKIGQLAGAVLGRSRGDAALRALLLAAWDADPVRRSMAERGLRVGRGSYEIWTPEMTPPGRPDRLVAEAVDLALDLPIDAPRARAFVGREAIVVDVARVQLRIGRHLVLEQLVAIAEEAEAEQLASIRRVVLGLRRPLRELTRSSELRSIRSAALLLPFAGRAEDASLVVHAAAMLPPRDAAPIVERLGAYPWKDVRGAMVSGLQSAEPRHRAAALRALSRASAASEDGEAVDLVRRLASDGDPEVQVAAIEALGALRRDDATEMLSAIYDGVAPASQRAIRTALRQMGTERADRAARALDVRPSVAVCEGNQTDLTELLADDCVGAFDISDP